MLDLLRRTDPDAVTDPDRPMLHAFIWVDCMTYLLWGGHRLDEVYPALLAAPTSKVWEAALLALEHAPEHALPLFRRALRSDDALVRGGAAAALALLAQPWSRRELLAVLQESDDPRRTAECRAALMEVHDPAARAAVRRWEERCTADREGSPLTDESLGLIQEAMQHLHDRVMPLRSRVPPEV